MFANIFYCYLSFLSSKFIYLVFVCVHACMGVCTYLCALACACGTQGFWKGVFLCCSLPYIWNRISLNLDPTHSASLAGQWAACIYLCPLPQQRSNRLQICAARTIFSGAGDLKSPSPNFYMGSCEMAQHVKAFAIQACRPELNPQISCEGG